GGAVVRGVLPGDPVVFPEPPPEVNQPAPARTERIVRVVLPGGGHRRVTDGTPHLTHRFGPPRTSGIPHSIHVTASLRLLRAALEEALELVLLARRALGQHRGGERLQFLEGVAAGLALVVVGGHGLVLPNGRRQPAGVFDCCYGGTSRLTPAVRLTRPRPRR